MDKHCLPLRSNMYERQIEVLLPPPQVEVKSSALLRSWGGGKADPPGRCLTVCLLVLSGSGEIVKVLCSRLIGDVDKPDKQMDDSPDSIAMMQEHKVTLYSLINMVVVVPE